MENTRDWLSRLLEMIPIKGTLDYRCFLGAPWRIDFPTSELGEIPYSFRIDPEFGKLYASVCKDLGMQTATVDYHGFPIDTGTVVALKLLNPNNAVPASVVSCNMYAERDETRALGRASDAGMRRIGSAHQDDRGGHAREVLPR